MKSAGSTLQPFATAASLVLVLFLACLPMARGSHLFYCDDGQPFPIEFLCNGVADCASGTDEENCSPHCMSYEQPCMNESGQYFCLNQALVCDGLAHCVNNSDETNCEIRECMSWEFRCNDSSCVRKLFVCDGDLDCIDGSDELDCGPLDCSEQEFACNNGECIPASMRCDDINDCSDGSDELICNHGACFPGLFQCESDSWYCLLPKMVCDGNLDCHNSDGQTDEEGCTYITCEDGFTCPGPEVCIESCQQCDGRLDCVDGSDEMGCEYDCGENHFRCLNGDCVSYDFVCDGYANCDDNSDENHCDYIMAVGCEGLFPCADGYQCVPAELQCNGMPDCTDESDEQFCPAMPSMANECNTSNGGCEGVCHNTPHSYYCTCAEGYRVDPDNHQACVDVDECTDVGTCSQLCVNTIGGYECNCVDGYEQSATNGCIADGGPGLQLLFTNKYDIQRFDLKSQSLERVVVNLSSVVGIDYHYRLGRIFWTDVMEGAIMSAAMNGTNKTVVVEGLTRPEGVAIDWIHDKLFWTDSLKSTVEVASLDGSVRAVLYSGLCFPKDIVVDPFRGMLYWTEHGDECQSIKYGPVDGSEWNHLHANGLFFPSGLSLDLPSQTIYWVDTLNHVIEVSLTSQGGRRPIYTTSVNSSFGLTLFEDTMYWTEKEKGTIMAANRLKGSNVTVILNGIYSALDIVAVHPLRQPSVTTPDPCLVDNGGCSYLCLVVNGNRSCLCPADSNLLSDGFSCSDSNPIMIFSVTNEIRVSPLRSDQGAFSDRLPLDFTTSPDIGALAWESQNHIIFWADSASGSISSATIEGLYQKVIVDVDVVDVGGMAVDWVTRKLYWTDRHLETIFVCNLDGSDKTALVAPLYGEPTDVVVHPVQGWMFWGMTGSNAQIKRAQLDGNNSMTIYKYSKNVGSVIDGNPIAMVIDYQLNRLYWVDRERNSLYSMKLDGSDMQTLSSKLSNPSGLAENSGWLFFIEHNHHTIYNISKSPPYNKEVYLQNTEDIKTLTMFHRGTERPSTHPCWTDNGGCSHLCLTRQITVSGNIKISCACPTGLSLTEDGKTCKSKPQKYFMFARESDLSWLSSDTNYNFEATIPISPSPVGVSAIEVDWDRGQVYWVDPVSAVIYRADLLSGEKEPVVDKGLVRPTALSLDWAGQKLYWADSGTQRIEVCYTDGSARRVLVYGNNVDEVTSLALDLKLHYMFWINSGNVKQVWQAEMDGEGHMPVVSSPEVDFPTAITIDNQESSGRIVVADSKKIFSFNMKGKDKILLAKLEYDPVGIAVDEEFIYWVNGESQKFFRAKKFDGSDMVALAKTYGTVKDFKIAISRDKGSLHYPCVNIKQCSDLCLPNSDYEYYTCACPTGIRLNSDQSSCPKLPLQYLLFPMDGSVGRISLVPQDFNEVVLTSIQPPSEVNFIDYLLESADEGRIFWSQGNSIRTADLDGGDARLFVSGLQTPKGLAVDWTTGNVYFVDSTSGRIEVVSKSGSDRKHLFELDDIKPTGLAVHPQQGILFWSDWSLEGSARIEVASMDGSNRSALVTSDISQPSQLVISEQHLYWVDTKKKTLERVKLDGSGREQVFTDLNNPFGLAIFDDSVFWSDQEMGRIVEEQKSNRLRKEVYMDMGVGVPKGLAIVTSGRLGELDNTQSAGPCSYKNGGCRHFCLPVSDSLRTCACPDLQDGQVFAGDCTEETGTPPIPPPPTSPPAITEDPHTPSTASEPVTTDSNSDAVDNSASPSVIDSNGSGTTGSYGFSPVEIAFLVVIIVILIVIALLVGAIFFMSFNHKTESAPALSKTSHASVQLVQVKNPLYQEVSAKNFYAENPPAPLYNNSNAHTRNSSLSVKPLTPRKLPLMKRAASAGPVKISSATANSLGLQCHEVEPTTYRITPVPPRRKSASSPPSSPVMACADVHYPLATSQKKQPVTPSRVPLSHCVDQQESKKAYRPPPATPKELSVRVPSSSLTHSSKKSVKFVPEVELSNPLPPPLPPRVPIPSSPPPYEEAGSPPTSIQSRHSTSSPCSSEDGEETTLFLGKQFKPRLPAVTISATNPHAVSPDRLEESDRELSPTSL